MHTIICVTDLPLWLPPSDRAHASLIALSLQIPLLSLESLCPAAHFLCFKLCVWLPKGFTSKKKKNFVFGYFFANQRSGFTWLKVANMQPLRNKNNKLFVTLQVSHPDGRAGHATRQNDILASSAVRSTYVATNRNKNQYRVSYKAK